MDLNIPKCAITRVPNKSKMTPKIFKTNKPKQNLLASPTIIRQKIKIVNTILRMGVAYSFHAVPYSMPDIQRLEKQIIAITKAI